MKKILLTLAVASMSLAASAYTLEAPDFFEENFVNMGDSGLYPSDGWLTLGNGAVPAGVTANMFDKEGKGPYYTFFDVGTQTVPMANTNFVGGAQADEWLISPEVEVPYDATTLFFTVYGWNYADNTLGTGSSTTHNFKVMVSEGGTDREDFTQIAVGSTAVSMQADPKGDNKIVAINGYQGKKVRFAFVATGSNQGLTGFTNISWGQYSLVVDSNLTAELAEVGKPISIDYNLKMRAPETCPALHVDLYINGEKVKENDYKKAFGSATSLTSAIQRVQFKNVYTPTTEEPINYKLVFSPAFEGAVETILEGGIGFPKVQYKNNVVIEEMTGTGCGWCPRGIAALNYYHDTYPGSETQGKVINIGVHNTNFGNDPMAIGNERYNVSIGEVNGSTSMPGCTMNRVTRGLDPTNALSVEELLGQTSHNEAKIVEVAIPEGDETYDLYDQTATVTFEVKNGYDSSMRNLSAAVVLIENDVKGINREYNQSNYLASNYTNGDAAYRAFVSLGAVPGMTKYLNEFTGAGELGQATVSFQKMVYQHVSRGIFPSFEGVAIGKDWVSDVPQRFSIDFTIPSTVLDIKNTEVAVLIINDIDRTIVASDIFPASQFEVNGIEEVNTDSAILISKQGQNLEVSAIDGSKVEVYALDGVKLATYEVTNGRLNTPANWNGPVVVKVTNAAAVKSAKLLF
ncbi:MAG: choice-of-anchor J domain-containing protein [Muribaculaceae bacterium]|nr:choice-of-anchor J domain-containing protein [Muribaculaceae bacterium]